MTAPTAKPSAPNLRKAHNRADKTARPNLVQYMISDLGLVAGAVIFPFLDTKFLLPLI